MEHFRNRSLRRSFVRLFIPSCVAIAAMVSAIQSGAAEITAEWIGTGYGDWTNSANWKNGIVPVRSSSDQYNVIIDRPDSAAYTQSSLDRSMEVSQLTLGEVLYMWGNTTPPSFTVRDRFHWTGGALSGWAAQYHLYGDALFDGPADKTLDRECTLDIHDGATWTQGNLVWQGGAVTIEPSAVFSMLTGGNLGGSSPIKNLGTIVLQTNRGTVISTSHIYNSGLLDLKAGDLQLFGGFEGSGGISIQPGARLIVPGIGTWDGGRQYGSGELALSGDQYLRVKTTFSWFTRITGSFAGSGDAILVNAVWEAGGLGGDGALIVPPNGKLVIQGQQADLGRDTLNQGNITLANSARMTGQFGNNRTFTNDSAAALHLSSASTFGASGCFVNQGGIVKDDGAGNADFFPVLLNSGVVRSTAGRITMQAGGTNFGRFEVQAPGSVEACGLTFADSSSLVGDGLISFRGGSLSGAVDTNLDIKATDLTIAASNAYAFKTLQVAGGGIASSGAAVTVSDHLTLNAGMAGGKISSLQSAELSFAWPSELAGGAQLQLLGESTLSQGSLTIRETNSSLVNSGTLHISGDASLLVSSGGGFTNKGSIKLNSRIGSFKAVLMGSSCRFLATNSAPLQTIEDGDFGILGPVTSGQGQISAGPNAQLAFSDVSVTNATVKLTQSLLNATSSFTSSNTTVLLDKASVVTPAVASRGYFSIAGEGTIQGALFLEGLKLSAIVGNNDLTVKGSMAMTGGTNSSFVVTPVQVADRVVFPHLKVDGPVSLDTRFALSSSFVPNGINFVAGPTTILESDQPIIGDFVGIRSGAVLSTTNSFYFQVFYGPSSPYGANKVVITGFGSAFDRWRMSRFTPEELQNSSISGPQADPDHNGLDNLAEFALAMDPETNGLNRPSLMPNPEGYVTIRVCQRKDIGRLSPRIAVSSDLLNWKDIPLGTSQSWLQLYRTFEFEDHYEFRYRYPGTPPSLFLRIVVGNEY